MNFRLIVEYHDTGITTKQYFSNTNTPNTIINYLDNALKSGAKLKYVLQQKTKMNLNIMDNNSYGYIGWETLLERG